MTRMTRRLIVRGPGLRGPAGRDGEDGLPGVNALPADEAVAGYVSTPSSNTATALAGTFVSMRMTPPSPDATPAYIDISVVPPLLRRWNGSAWIPALPAESTPAESGPGWAIKAGSLDVFRASKANQAEGLAEWVYMGDSTGQGSGDTLGGIVPELRRLFIGDGGINGGQGLARFSMTAAESGDNLAPVVSSTFTGPSGNQFDLYNGNTAISTVIGQSATVQGRGTRARLYYTRQSNLGRFTYSIDGASAITVDSFQNAANSRIGVVEIDGLDDGLHELTITNIGVTQSTSPTTVAIDMSGPGQPTGFSSGTVYYVVTATTAAGETAPSSPISIAIPNGPRTITVAINRLLDAAITGYRFYRSTTGAPGSYGFVGTVVSNATFPSFDDLNTATPGVAPPTTDTSGLASIVDAPIHVDVEWLRDTGFVIHNNATSGAAYESWFGTSPTDPDTAAQAALSVAQGGTQNTDHLQPPAPRPPWRNASLAICTLGINNVQGSGGTESGLDAALARVQIGAEKFARFCTASGCDGVLISPHFKRALHGDVAYGGSTAAQVFRDAVIEIADTHGLSWLDYDAALDAEDYPEGGQPHLDHAGYVIEAQSLYANILGK